MEAVVANFQVGTEKYKENLSQDSRQPSQDSNLSLSEYKSEALLLEAVRSLCTC
jgi:hypothetical protein